jgi:hypothetical protein
MREVPAEKTVGNMRRSVVREIARTRQRSRSPSSTKPRERCASRRQRLVFPTAAKVIAPRRRPLVSNPGGEGPEVENRADDRIAVEKASGKDRSFLRPPGGLASNPAPAIPRKTPSECAEIDEAATSGGERFEVRPSRSDPDLEGEVVSPAERK